MAVSTQVIRQIFDEDDGVCIEVGPWPDDPDALELRTVGKKNTDWFGKINLSMSKEFARELGKALIASADGL